VSPVQWTSSGGILWLKAWDGSWQPYCVTNAQAMLTPEQVMPRLVLRALTLAEMLGTDGEAQDGE